MPAQGSGRPSHERADASTNGSALVEWVRARMRGRENVGTVELAEAAQAWAQSYPRELQTEPRREAAGGVPVPARRTTYDVVKRVLDVVLAAVGLVLTAPLIGVLAALVKLDSPGPAFFGHERLTLGGRKFRCWKLRTMTADAHERLRRDPDLWKRYVENGYKIPLEEDPRITRIGRFLRKTSLDELPQLWNVLVGEMSLVGPRAIVEEELRWYGRHAAELLSVRPGITGAWQVMGRNRIGYPERALVELGYVRRRSLGLDVRILLTSLPTVLTARGNL